MHSQHANKKLKLEEILYFFQKNLLNVVKQGSCNIAF